MIKEAVNVLPEQLRILELSRDELQEIINEGQHYLTEAKAKQKKTGVWADAENFAKIKTSVREATVKLHEINRNIKEVHRQLNRANPKAAYFQQAAKKLLSPRVYEEVNSQANRWMSKKGD
jgi:nanoRNase/pAp phosphatase (c-di-AMP/oligoRNAs hydrolase)